MRLIFYFLPTPKERSIQSWTLYSEVKMHAKSSLKLKKELEQSFHTTQGTIEHRRV